MWWQQLSTVVKSFLSSFSREYNEATERTSAPCDAQSTLMQSADESMESSTNFAHPTPDAWQDFLQFAAEMDAPSDPEDFTAPFETSLAAEILGIADDLNLMVGRYPFAPEADRYSYGGAWGSTLEEAFEKWKVQR